MKKEFRWVFCVLCDHIRISCVLRFLEIEEETDFWSSKRRKWY